MSRSQFWSLFDPVLTLAISGNTLDTVLWAGAGKWSLKSRIRDPVENKPLPSVTSVYLIPRFHVDTPTGLQQHFSMFGQCSDNGGCPNKSNQLWKKTGQWADTSRTKNRLIMTNTELGKRCPCPEVNFGHFPGLILTLTKYENTLESRYRLGGEK